MSRRVRRPLAKSGGRGSERLKGASAKAAGPGKATRSSGRGEAERSAGERWQGTRPGKPQRAGAPRNSVHSAEKPAEPAPAPLPTKVQTVAVSADEANMRVDRFLEARFPGLSFSHIQRIVRKGELRVNGRRADSKDRLDEGDKVRIPPLKLDTPKAPACPGTSTECWKRCATPKGSGRASCTDWIARRRAAC